MISHQSRILVAEDDRNIRMTIIEVLQSAGFSELMEANDGAEACHLLAIPDHVVLLLTDVNLPQVSGIEVAQSAKSRHPGIKIIFISADPDRLDTVPFAYRFLRKPFSMNTLITAVAEIGMTYSV